MYGEKLMSYLLKYQNEEMKPASKKEKKQNFKLNNVQKKKYATIPVNSK